MNGAPIIFIVVIGGIGTMGRSAPSVFVHGSSTTSGRGMIILGSVAINHGRFPMGCGDTLRAADIQFFPVQRRIYFPSDPNELPISEHKVQCLKHSFATQCAPIGR